MKSDQAHHRSPLRQALDRAAQYEQAPGVESGRTPDLDDPFAPTPEPENNTPRAEAMPSPALGDLLMVNGVRLARMFLPQEAAARYVRLAGSPPPEPGEGPDPFDDGKGQVLRGLQAMAHDPLQGFRRLVVGDATQIQAVERLMEAAPNLSKPLEIILTSLRASSVTRTPLDVPPICLLGPPGVGKSHLCHGLGEALATKVVDVSVPSISGGFIWSGTDLSWKNPRPGIVADALIFGATAQPLFVLDEIDKAPRLAGHEDPLGALHALLEPQNARGFRDDGLGVTFAANRCLWVCSANALDGLLPSLVDRLLVMQVQPPNTREMGAILRHMITGACAKWPGWFDDDVDDACVSALRALPPRQVRRILGLACACAVAGQRDRLDVTHIEQAMRWRGGAGEKAPMGFVKRP